jgi:hypothetical protein
MNAKYIFMFLTIFSVLLFTMVILKRTYIAQILGPGIPEPFAEKIEDLQMFLQPY